MTPTERQKIVEEVILELGLKECASTRIGNEDRKGCSGGEKRRTSLGVQMLANPSVLFLDEVTSGLDATSAFQLVRTLKYLTTKGRTIVMTIHQPRSEIWGLFDRLVLLAEGCSIYTGPANPSISHFERLGHKLPPFMNPAEYLIDLTAVDTRRPELETASRARVQSLKSAWQPSLPLPEAVAMHVEIEKSASAPTRVSAPGRPELRFGREVRVQTARALKMTIRDPLGMVGSLTEATILAIIAGWIFVQVDESLAGIKSRQGAMYIAACLQGYIVLLFEVYRLIFDIRLFHRERSEGAVGALSFLISRRLAKMVLEDVTVPLIFSVIYYFFIGFRPLASQFLTFFALMLLNHYATVTFATCCVAAFGDFTRASLVANLIYTFQNICSEL
jgi:energy-coupling factor transporter ATP-binding protein EcfA2